LNISGITVTPKTEEVLFHGDTPFNDSFMLAVSRTRMKVSIGFLWSFPVNFQADIPNQKLKTKQLINKFINNIWLVMICYSLIGISSIPIRQ
jgi:hypothetical protein